MSNGLIQLMKTFSKGIDFLWCSLTIKYIKVINAMYINNNAKVKVVKEVSSWFCSKSGVKLFCVLCLFG